MELDLPNDSGSERSSSLMTVLRKVAPWAIAATILYFLFSRVPLADAWAAAREADLALFIPLMAGAVLLWFLIDSAAFAFLFTRFNARLDWVEARSLRGMTYLVTPINWNLGTAAVILHLRSSKNIGAIESTSTMILYQMVDGVVLGSFALVGLILLPGSSEIPSLKNVVAGFVVFQFVSLGLLVSRWPRFQIFDRIRGIGLFRSHKAAVWRDIALLTAMKGLYFGVFIGVYWLGGHAFDVQVPLSLAAAATPVILLAGALPITPAGLGTQQAAMLYFFAPYGEEASILALGLTFPVALLVLRALVGLAYLKDLPKLRDAIANRKVHT
jgi:uncharacterized membrane protein YbhN (UPF0104 family)